MLQRVITEVKQLWSFMKWVTKNLYLVLLVLQSYVERLLPAAFTVVSTHQSTLGPRGGLWPVLLM
jgi:hypothetical protein